jgi:hypothetical protein
MTNDLLTKATALLEAREKATQGAIRIEEIVSDSGGRYQAATTDYSCDILTGKRLDLDFFALAANTACETIQGYQGLMGRMADTLELAGKALEDCMISHAPGQDFAETVKISSKRQRIIASQESISKVLAEARNAILHTPTAP